MSTKPGSPSWRAETLTPIVRPAPLGSSRHAASCAHAVSRIWRPSGMRQARSRRPSRAPRPARRSASGRTPRSRRRGPSPPARSAGRRPRARVVSIARRRSPSRSSRRITCLCIAASNTAWRPLPSAFARYMATSASRITCSGADFAVASAIPIEESMNSSRPSITNGALRLCRTRSAITVASRGSDTSSSRSVNSSPESRATVSFGPQRRFEPARDLLQQLVAARVAEAVVDDLEAVQVQEQHRRAGLRVAALGAADRLVQAVQEQHAVRQAGERVVERVVLEAALGLAAVGRVGRGADDPRGPVVLVANGGAAGEQPAVGAVAVLHAVLEVEVVLLGGAVHERVERLRERRAVVGVDAAEPFAARLADLDLAVAEHRLPARGVVDAVAGRRPSPRRRRWRRAARARGAPRTRASASDGCWCVSA